MGNRGYGTHPPPRSRPLQRARRRNAPFGLSFCLRHPIIRWLGERPRNADRNREIESGIDRRDGHRNARSRKRRVRPDAPLLARRGESERKPVPLPIQRFRGAGDDVRRCARRDAGRDGERPPFSLRRRVAPRGVRRNGRATRNHRRTGGHRGKAGNAVPVDHRERDLGSGGLPVARGLPRDASDVLRRRSARL